MTVSRIPNVNNYDDWKLVRFRRKKENDSIQQEQNRLHKQNYSLVNL